MEKDMDETKTAQQTSGQLTDTGPMPLDVLQAQLTLQERSALDAMQQLRRDLAEKAADTSVRWLEHMVGRLRDLETQLHVVRFCQGTLQQQPADMLL
jgi:hypothetical protein